MSVSFLLNTQPKLVRWSQTVYRPDAVSTNVDVHAYLQCTHVYSMTRILNQQHRLLDAMNAYVEI